MTAKTLSKENFKKFAENLVKSERTIGVKAKETKYEFGNINNADEIVMDYDVTLRSPRTFFQPPKEKLFDFKLGANTEIKPNIEADPFVLLGIHSYDLKALNQMDIIWDENNADQHYKARRNAATVIALEPTQASEWSFWGSMDSSTVDKGYDLLLTDIGNKYYVEVGTEKGANLLSKYASAEDATNDDNTARDKVRSELPNLCKADRKVKCDTDGITASMKNSYNNAIWEKLAEKCYSCGSCNLVCPTCYCFDVKDTIELDLATGQRTRKWDGCLLEPFAKVAGDENFRENRADRFRHRILRKTVYVADKLNGELACVGCGRCSSTCLPDITDPVKILNELCS
ncbi:MAG: 4Fe-4S dicluster domain-containing protein [Deltaproteobacteria bacterium]|nr:4Fe-4S dicluster domain-containing protein [Deltaproteobacteria bacterium]